MEIVSPRPQTGAIQNPTRRSMCDPLELIRECTLSTATELWGRLKKRILKKTILRDGIRPDLYDVVKDDVDAYLDAASKRGSLNNMVICEQFAELAWPYVRKELERSGVFRAKQPNMIAQYKAYVEETHPENVVFNGVLVSKFFEIFESTEAAKAVHRLCFDEKIQLPKGESTWMWQALPFLPNVELVYCKMIELPLLSYIERHKPQTIKTYVTTETSFVYYVLLADWFKRTQNDLSVTFDYSREHKQFVENFLNGQLNFTKDSMDWVRERHAAYKKRVELFKFCLMCGSHDPKKVHSNTRGDFACGRRRHETLLELSGCGEKGKEKV